MHLSSIKRSNELDEAVEYFLARFKTGLFQFKSNEYEKRYEEVKQFFLSLGCLKDEANIACRMTSDEWDNRETKNEIPFSFFNKLSKGDKNA